MLLKMKTLMTMALVSFSLSAAQAASLADLETGRYTFSSGEKHVCNDFTVTESMKTAKRIMIGGFYGYEILKSDYIRESDLDETCEFHEQNRVNTNDNGDMVLLRINEEFCKGNLRSKTVSEATIRAGEISVRHQVGGADYTCIWKK
ncbi:MAG: hypothetical protein HUU57_11195 [Bdellovibrio sp.]|nr:hypothetical protein [Bdellovibrio sp.]